MLFKRRQDNPGNANGGDQHQCGCGKKASGSSRVEFCKVDSTPIQILVYQQTRDEISGENKEDVHADKSASEDTQSDVIADYKKDSYTAQSFDIGPERMLIRWAQCRYR